MHEHGIAKKIIAIVSDQLVQSKVRTEVQKVVFKAGRLHAIIPESLTLHFDVLKKEAPLMHHATLVIDEVPLRGFCPHDSAEFELREPIFLCPRCGGPLETRTGNEMYVDGIEVADPETERG